MGNGEGIVVWVVNNKEKFIRKKRCWSEEETVRPREALSCQNNHDKQLTTMRPKTGWLQVDRDHLGRYV